MKSIVLLFLLVLSIICASCSALNMHTNQRMMMTMSTSKYLGNKPVFVAGGSRGVGLELIHQLVKRGTPVRTIARGPESISLLRSMPLVSVTVGDALDPSIVKSAMEGSVAAVTMLGGRVGDRRADSIGNQNVIEQAGILGVERIVLLTSIGCGSSKAAVSKDIYSLFEETLVAKEAAEKTLKLFTNLDWTIVRPGGLRSGPATGKAIVTEDHRANGLINRADLATLLVDVLGSNGLATRRELSSIDPSIELPVSEVHPVHPLKL